jgi:MOB kinase activator 1
LTFLKGSGNLRLAVKLPEGEDLSEWLAVHGEFELRAGPRLFSVDEVIQSLLAVDFFNHLNMLYGTVTEFCTPQEVRLYPSPRILLSLKGARIVFLS